jgi:hypothetical protein
VRAKPFLHPNRSASRRVIACARVRACKGLLLA